ncbi:DEKNAAC101348 [Brettanomyces naardenensis]|uniref:DEKNAAC101348 n=1 Tax=Brettanomyces naardenensis TaxID=13370 RepID=A0A448YHR3_BRENA|nr:DEKNAAC101348 [Brettanomyces naardenensis]
MSQLDIENQKAFGPPDETGIVTVQSNEYSVDAHSEKSSFLEEEPLALEEGHRLHKDLKPRQITMIAIGGALGTGLLIGTTSALANAGPASVLIAYSLVGSVVFFTMAALGEMSSFIPLPEGFSGYAKRYCDDALGFAVGISYLCKYLIVAPNQLVAGALVMQYWVSPEKVNPGVWVAIILVLVIIINTLGVGFFGEVEFYLSSLKVITILALIVLLFCIMLGGDPSGDRIGFRYWKDPGAFAPYEGVEPQSLAKFVAFLSVLVTAVFAYLGTELVGITFGEAKNPRYTIKKAIKLTLIRIIVFYIFSVFLLGCCVAYNDPALLAAKKATVSNAAASAFVVAINNAKISGLPDVMNACILIFIISATNSDLYIATRNAYGLSANGMFPKVLSRTNSKGVPIFALGFASLFCCLAFMVCSSSSQKVFNYFVNVVSIFGLLTWISILVTFLYFMKAVKAQGYDRNKDFVYKAPFQPYGTYIALTACVFISLIKNFTVFIGHGPFDYQTFITGYIGIPVYLICLVAYKVIKKTKTVLPEEADLVTYKAPIDAEQLEYEEMMAEKAARRKEQGKGKDLEWWYDHTLGYMF